MTVQTLDNDGTQTVYISDDKQFKIMEPQTLNGDIEIQQMISGSFQDKEYKLQAYFIANSVEINLSVFTLLWNTIYEVKYNGIDISHQGISDFQGTDPYYLIADLQYCYYPEIPLEKALHEAGIELKILPLSDGWIRRFYSDDDLIIEIKRNGSKLQYTNYLREYAYSIEEYSN